MAGGRRAPTKVADSPPPAQLVKPAEGPQAEDADEGSEQKVVGPNVTGKREEYQLTRHLMSALFGGVYEAKGLSTGKDFAIKVLHKSEVSRTEELRSIEFCEVPLSEVRFAELMRGHEHVMEPEEYFEDNLCFYVVFQLAHGGDLLEALKKKPHGFDEAHAQFFIKQAAKGLAFLHGRRVAMQDVSLENLLLHVDESTGGFRVKICDPGQAVVFEVSPSGGAEVPVDFRGMVGKSFRPPELMELRPYRATQVDSWCLGWSTFYLLAAQPLFLSADPKQQDPDWLLFRRGDYGSLLQQKHCACSQMALDFILRLMHLDPSKRMSIADALGHAWLADPRIPACLLPAVVLPEARRAALEDAADDQAAAGLAAAQGVAPPACAEVAAAGGAPSAWPPPGSGVQPGTVAGPASVPSAAPRQARLPAGSLAVPPPGGAVTVVQPQQPAVGGSLAAAPARSSAARLSPPPAPGAPQLAPQEPRQARPAASSAPGREWVATNHSPPPWRELAPAAPRSAGAPPTARRALPWPPTPGSSLGGEPGSPSRRPLLQRPGGAQPSAAPLVQQPPPTTPARPEARGPSPTVLDPRRIVGAQAVQATPRPVSRPPPGTPRGSGGASAARLAVQGQEGLGPLERTPGRVGHGREGQSLLVAPGSVGASSAAPAATLAALGMPMAQKALVRRAGPPIADLDRCATDRGFDRPRAPGQPFVVRPPPRSPSPVRRDGSPAPVQMASPPLQPRNT
ncbi:unnamed protein product, partial [Prorocentrum cordatum]